MKMKKYSSVEAYIADFPPDVSKALVYLRRFIKKLVPDAEERISYGIPTYRYLKKPLVGIGGYKDHCSFYIMNATMLKDFKNDLKDYKFSGGTIHFNPDKPLSDKLLKKLIEAKIDLIEKL